MLIGRRIAGAFKGFCVQAETERVRAWENSRTQQELLQRICVKPVEMPITEQPVFRSASRLECNSRVKLRAEELFLQNGGVLTQLPSASGLWCFADGRIDIISLTPDSQKLRRHIRVAASSWRYPTGFSLHESTNESFLDQLPFRAKFQCIWTCVFADGEGIQFWATVREPSEIPLFPEIESVQEALSIAGACFEQHSPRKKRTCVSLRPATDEHSPAVDLIYVVHDLLTPVQTAACALDALNSVVSDEQRELVAVVHAAFIAQRELLRAFLIRHKAISSGADEEPSMSLQELVESTVQSVEISAKRNDVQIVLEPPPEVDLKMAREDLWRILSNLFSNAIRQTSQVGCYDSRIYLECSLSDDDSYPLELSIRDYCRRQNYTPRLASAQHAHFVDPYSGFGMGLNIIRKLCADWNLKLRAQPSLGGTTFLLAFPKEIISKRTTVSHGPNSTLGTVLVLDDNELAARTRARSLLPYCEDVRWATDIDSAVQQLESQPEMLLVVDFKLGEETALDVLKKLSRPVAGVVVCTGAVMESAALQVAEFEREGIVILDKCRSAGTIWRNLTIHQMSRKPTQIIQMPIKRGVKGVTFSRSERAA